MERGGSSWYGGHGTLRGRVDGSEEEHTTTLPEGTMEETRGLASPGSGEARRKVHSQPQDCLDLRAGRGGGEVRIAAWRRARSSFLVE